MDMRTTWPSLLNALLAGENLTADETAWAMGEIMSGTATSAQIAAFAVALRAKGETVAEVTGLARAMPVTSATVSPLARSATANAAT